jgi:hypothetical protein
LLADLWNIPVSIFLSEYSTYDNFYLSIAMSPVMPYKEKNGYRRFNRSLRTVETLAKATYQKKFQEESSDPRNRHLI